MKTMARASAAKGSRMRLRDIPSANAETIGPRVAANVAWSRMQRRGIRYLLVTEKGRPLGVLSARRLGGEAGAEIRKRRMVEDLMTPRVATAEPAATLSQALNLMQELRVGCLLIEEDGQPARIVTASDVLDELGRDPLRAPLPGWLPKAAKRASEAHATPAPAHIRMLGANLSKEQRNRIRQELGARLGKFADSVERVSVRVEDVNGPRGGIDQVCRIKVVLSKLPSVVFESQNASLDAAIASALAGIELAVRRKLQRRRMKPIKTGARSRTLSS